MAEGSFTSFVLDQLDALGQVRAKSMFGGQGLYHGDTFFAIVYDGRLYFKVDEATRPRYEAAGTGPFQPNPRQTMRSYHEVPAEVLEDRDELVAWAKQALQVAGG